MLCAPADFLYNQIKFSRLNSANDYINLSGILSEEEGLDSAIKLLDKAIKKMPDEAQLYFQKIRIYSSFALNDKVKEVLNTISKKFN